jgi:hypothetical protein
MSTGRDSIGSGEGIEPRTAPRADSAADSDLQQGDKGAAPPRADGQDSEPPQMIPHSGTGSLPGREILTPGSSRRPLAYPPREEAPPRSSPILLASVTVVVFLLAAGWWLAIQRPGPSGSSDRGVPARLAHAIVTATVSFGGAGVEAETQSVTFDQPVGNITLTVPKTAISAVRSSPIVSNIQVSSPTRGPIVISQSLNPGTGVTLDLPTATNHIDIIYSVLHTDVLAASSAGKVARVVSPLRMATAGTTSTLHVQGADVTSVRCVARGGAQSACAVRSVNGWTVHRDASNPPITVVAEVKSEG